MNILIDNLPDSIHNIPINTDFRAMILFELMLNDKNVPDDIKLTLALNYLYTKPVSDLPKAVDGLIWYYSCGKSEKDNKSISSGSTNKRAYDFDVDAPMIYAAFIQVYNIDLNTVNLHWWKFCALFHALPKYCCISEIMGYRTIDCSKLKGEEKSRYIKLQKEYELEPLNISRLSLSAAEDMTKKRIKDRFNYIKEQQKKG